MNSEIIPNNYANSNEMLYGAHYATLVSGGVSYENPVGKFVLSYATPNMNDGSAYSNTLPKNNTKNIVNKENLAFRDVKRIVNAIGLDIKIDFIRSDS